MHARKAILASILHLPLKRFERVPRLGASGSDDPDWIGSPWATEGLGASLPKGLVWTRSTLAFFRGI
jgi:hypothetical protein